MKKKNRPISKIKSRRQFLLGGLLVSAGIASGKNVLPDQEIPKGKKVKMLTPTGQLVEVDEALLAGASRRKKAGNKEILEWIEKPHRNDDEQ